MVNSPDQVVLEGIIGDYQKKGDYTAQRKTSAKVAKQSSKVLRGTGTAKDVKASAASALSQRAPKAKPSRSPRKK